MGSPTHLSHHGSQIHMEEPASEEPDQDKDQTDLGEETALHAVGLHLFKMLHIRRTHHYLIQAIAKALQQQTPNTGRLYKR